MPQHSDPPSPAQSIHATDLETEVARLHRGTRTSAHYTAAEHIRTVHLVRSGRLLSIALMNSGIDRLPAPAREGLLRRIADLGAEWLRARSLLVPGTLVSVGLQREVDLKVVSWAWGKGGQAYWVTDAGALSTEAPPRYMGEGDDG